jgi:2-methylisocitrate lyase-like PEP mutase family enzyme
MSGKAAALRALHVPGQPVILPNVWDVSSARTVAEAGFPALATSSAAVAASLGYADGEAMPVAEALAAIRRIAAAVDLPVTADFERGYGLAPAELVERLVEAGAVGCNLEDSDPRTKAMVDPDEQADFLAEVRVHSGADLVINARVDVFVRGLADPVPEGIRRARRYHAAGADCVYPIVASDPEAIAELVRESGAPVNILSRPGAPSLAELAALGVARVTFGSGLHRSVHQHLESVLEAVKP